MLAHHWHAAREPGPAFVASVRAGMAAEKVRALADAAAHYERALQLWDRVDDPVTEAGMSRADLLMRAADAVHYSSHSPRAITLVKAALEALAPDVTPECRAMVLQRLGRMYWTQYQGATGIAAREQAVALLAGRPASREQAFTLAALGQSLMLRGLIRQAESVLSQAIAVAAEVGAYDVEGHALCSLGPVLVGLGRVDESLAALDRAAKLSGRHGSTADVGRCYTNRTHVLLYAGRYAEVARVAEEGMAYAERTGHLRHYGESITGNLIAALTCAGRWREADAAAERLFERVTAEDPYVVLRWLPLLIGQGRLDRARELADWSVARTAEADDVQFRALALLRAADLARAEQRFGDARALAAEALAGMTKDEQFYGLPGYALAIAVEADRIAAVRISARAEPEIDEAKRVAGELIAAARAFAAGLAGAGVPLLPQPSAALLTAEAEHARAMGSDEPDGWQAVAVAWESVRQPHSAALARFREADAALRTRGDRVRAAEAAAAALAVAEELGAEPLAEQIRLLVQRGRLDLSSAPAEEKPGPLAELGITPREADVLALLAAGMTNRQIGESLFISEKTASVHVTNLLRKLGVSNRLEAAVIAQNLGLS
jgi:DNA-binding CsgD family transcriptional regulator